MLLSLTNVNLCQTLRKEKRGTRKMKHEMKPNKA